MYKAAGIGEGGGLFYYGVLIIRLQSCIWLL